MGCCDLVLFYEGATLFFWGLLLVIMWAFAYDLKLPKLKMAGAVSTLGWLVIFVLFIRDLVIRLS